MIWGSNFFDKLYAVLEELSTVTPEIEIYLKALSPLGNFMRKIKFRGRNLDHLLNFLYDVFGERANTIKRVNGKIVGFFVWEKYYLRNIRATSCSIFYFQDDQNTCEIQIVGAAGSGGLFDIDWGSKSSIESITAETVIKYAADLELEKIEDIKIKVKEAYRHKRTFPRFPIR